MDSQKFLLNTLSGLTIEDIKEFGISLGYKHIRVKLSGINKYIEKILDRCNTKKINKKIHKKISGKKIFSKFQVVYSYIFFSPYLDGQSYNLLEELVFCIHLKCSNDIKECMFEVTSDEFSDFNNLHVGNCSLFVEKILAVNVNNFMGNKQIDSELLGKNINHIEVIDDSDGYDMSVNINGCQIYNTRM